MSNFYTEPFVSAGEMEFPSEPYITAQPQNHTALGVEDYVLTVIAAGAVSYQWEVFDGVSWSAIAGATSDTLAITIYPSMNGWRYRVLVTGDDGSTVTSKAAQIAIRGVQEITLEGAIVTFDGPALIKSLEADINAVQSGSGDPSPDNIRPISGWDTVNAVRTGKNLFEESADAFTLEDVNYKQQYIDVPEGTPLHITMTVKDPSISLSSGVYFGAFKAQGDSSEGYDWIISNGSERYSLSQTITGYQYITVYPKTALGLILQRYNIIVSIGTTASSYEPYNGTTYPITLPNTCYGGKIKDGVLTITHAIVDLGSLTWTKNWDTGDPTGVFYSPTLDYLNVNGDAINTNYIFRKGENPNTMEDKSITLFGSNRIYVKDTAYTNATVFKTAMSGVYLVYELATPIEITLSDFPNIEPLTGVNNIWADSGDVTVTIMR